PRPRRCREARPAQNHARRPAGSHTCSQGTAVLSAFRGRDLYVGRFTGPAGRRSGRRIDARALGHAEPTRLSLLITRGRFHRSRALIRNGMIYSESMMAFAAYVDPLAGIRSLGAGMVARIPLPMDGKRFGARA